MSLPQGLAEKYTLTRLLQARDGHQTFLAESTSHGELVVIKAFELAAGANWESLTLFEREIKTLQQLNHSRIPRLIDVYREEAPLRIYLVQAAINGHSLRQEINETGPVSENTAQRWARDVLNILDYLHCLHPPVIHRDIKPENLLLDEKGNLHLIDFGAVRDSTLNNNMTVAGTFGYMPPEQAAGQALPGTDLYTVGITLIECLSGKGPHELQRDKKLRLYYHNEVSISEHFKNWLDTLTDPDITCRPASAKEALHWLEVHNLPQTLGRLQANYPEAGVTEFYILPTRETQPDKTLWFSAAIETFPKVISWWLLMVVMIASLHTFALNLHPYLADFISFFHPYLLTFAGLWVGLSHMEVSAKKENAHYVQSLRFENHQVSYRGQTRHLKNLVTVDEGGYRKIYPLRPPSELSLIFQGEKTLHLPVQLTAEEILWFMHLLEKHK